MVILVALFGVHYLYLVQNGFNEQNYQIAFFILFLPSAIIGYIFLYITLQRLYNQEESLEHLIREVLHEINLPIATIEANIELLKRAESDSKRLKRLSRVANSTKRLRKLYKELSYEIKKEISLIEKEKFDLKELIEAEIEHFKSLGFDRFDVELESCFVYLDRVGLEQVVDNLIENALKYSKDKIEIKLKSATLSIKDYGVGMSESEILNIYTRYYQGDSSKKGEGIGLAIVKRYCDENRIELKIESAPNQGTKFSLFLDRVLD
jgi:signal transduction histidine kinase